MVPGLYKPVSAEVDAGSALDSAKMMNHRVSVPQRFPKTREDIDPDGGVSRSWKNGCKNNEVVQARMNGVTASQH